MGTVEGVRRPTGRAQQLRRDATPAERALWRELSGSKLGFKFSRQMPVGPYIRDFLCRAERLAIELDGDSHATTVGHDQRREHFIRAQGIRTIRFSNWDVMVNLEGVVRAIRDALGGNAHPQPLPRAGGEF
ncbi:MAG: endonuclease domain-containing protein [Sphingomonadales bacterium]|nr:MAG: endonuclease domain-containing protein [Sphingomonadales bacterium]